MRGKNTTEDKRGVKDHGDLSIEDGKDAHLVMQKRGEIAVFDAGKYFADVANQRSRIEETEEELRDGDGSDAEAGGDLPLSPLPEFYTTSKAKHYTRKEYQWHQGDKAAHVYAGTARIQYVPPAAKTSSGGAVFSSASAQRRVAANLDLLQRMPASAESLCPSPPSVASSGRDHVYNEPQGPPAHITNSTSDSALLQTRISSSAKPQPFSPSARLASFLAKFKLSSSESRSKPSSQYTSAPSPSTSSTSTPKSFFPNAATLPANSKPPSPRSRFLRALSTSSSNSNPLLKPVSHMHHHGSAVASTPVSPAGSDPYSPITHSASTTPTSHKNPRSRSRSHVSHLEAGTPPGIRPNLPTTDWRRDPDNSSSRSQLSAHLPFLRRKLKAYLMPEKSPRQHQEAQKQIMNNREKVHTHHVAHAGQDRRLRSDKVSATASISDMLHAVPISFLEARGDGRQQHGAYKENTALITDKARAAAGCSSAAAHTKAQLDQHQPYHSPMRSPGHRMMEPRTPRDTRRRGDWRRAHAEDVEDDIEVAERLLRVVKEHQTTSSYKGTINYRQQGNGYGVLKGLQGQGHVGGEKMNHGSSSRKSRKSLMSPSSSPAAANYHSKQASKEEFACPYDSDSSSDLFEIETLQAFSHVTNPYARPLRDLPVYDSSPLKSPLHLK